MPGSNDLIRHARLVDHMANALGLDLDEQMMRGKLQLSDVEDAVLSCTNCTQPCACEVWLAAQTETAPDTPNYCRNTALFEQLRDT